MSMPKIDVKYKSGEPSEAFFNFDFSVEVGNGTFSPQPLRDENGDLDTTSTLQTLNGWANFDAADHAAYRAGTVVQVTWTRRVPGGLTNPQAAAHLVQAYDDRRTEILNRNQVDHPLYSTHTGAFYSFANSWTVL